MKAKILIIEDDKELCSLVSSAFKLNNFNVLSANTIERALQIIAQEDMQVIFADIVIADKKSTDYLDEIIKKNPKVKIIITSAHYDLIKNEKQNSNILAIEKPYDLSKVIEQAKKLIIS